MNVSSTDPSENGLSLSASDRERLRVYEELVRKWSAVKNLVARAGLPELWTRHILDSVQVQRAVPDARVWVDIGSGGGFPGIVTAILLADVPGAHVHLVESDGRKCAFLRAVSRETGLSTTVHHARIEDVVPDFDHADAVSARALAEMSQLLQWSDPLLKKGAAGVFLKGRTIQDELTRISTPSRFLIEMRPSLSDSHGVLVLVRHNASDGV